MDGVQAVPRPVGPKLVILPQPLGAGLPPQRRQIQLLRQPIQRTLYRGHQKPPIASPPGREGKQAQIVQDPGLFDLHRVAAAVFGDEPRLLLVWPLLPGPQIPEEDPPPKGRHGHIAAAHEQKLRLLPYLHPVRPRHTQADGAQGGDAQHQRHHRQGQQPQQEQPQQPPAKGQIAKAAAHHRGQIRQPPHQRSRGAGVPSSTAFRICSAVFPWLSARPVRIIRWASVGMKTSFTSPGTT